MKTGWRTPHRGGSAFASARRMTSAYWIIGDAAGRRRGLPLRALANRRGTEVIFTLFRQPDMDDAMFARDAELVNADLQALKHYLESS